jgi:hypothetical protein
MKILLKYRSLENSSKHINPKARRTTRNKFFEKYKAPISDVV